MHMTLDIGFNEEELFATIVEEGMMQGIVEEPAYFALVDGIIEDLRRGGDVNTDQNLEGYAEHMKMRFREYQARQVD